MLAPDEKPADFESGYRMLFAEAPDLPHEQVLVRAYDLGRSAVARALGIAEVMSIHRAVTAPLLKTAADPAEAGRLIQDVLEEVLAPYDLVIRGVEEANDALRNINDLLEREARRIAHSLHDEAGQLIATLSLAVQCLGCEQQTTCGSSVHEVKHLVGQAELMFRRLSHEMRPRVLDEMGLLPALEFLAEGFSKRRNLAVEIENRLADRLCPLLESSIYRMVQVALPNVVRHAEASRATIRLALESTWVRCSVIDDGKGMDPAALDAAHSDGLGLLGIRERAVLLGGKLEITPVSPHGTDVSLYLPAIG